MTFLSLLIRFETIALWAYGFLGNRLLSMFSCALWIQSGRVLLDGVDIRNYSQEELRKNIGLVLQDPFLYHGTIKSNYQRSTKTSVMSRFRLQLLSVFGFAHSGSSSGTTPVSERGSSFQLDSAQLLTFTEQSSNQPKILIWMSGNNIDSETEGLVLSH